MAQCRWRGCKAVTSYRDHVDCGIVTDRDQVDDAWALVDGTVSFEDSHSYERMADPRVRAAKERVQLIADRALVDPAAPRSGLVEVTLRDGRTVSRFTRHAPGTEMNSRALRSVPGGAPGIAK